MTDVVQKLWGFCHTLCRDGVDYGGYVEQITYLLSLKMADERGVDLPNGSAWSDLRPLSGPALAERYEATLRALGRAPGVLGDVCAGAQSRFNNSVTLRRLVSLVDEAEWTALGVDVGAAAYEELLEKGAPDVGARGRGVSGPPEGRARA